MEESQVSPLSGQTVEVSESAFTIALVESGSSSYNKLSQIHTINLNLPDSDLLWTHQVSQLCSPQQPPAPQSHN